MRDKVLGIGFHKTATSSLGKSLALLAYNLAGRVPIENPISQQPLAKTAIDFARNYEAFKDNPWPCVFKEVDNAFPGSKFILTVRETNDWLESVVKHFGDTSTSMREFIYGVGFPKGNEHIYISRYERHNNEVVDYFRGRPDDLLIMDIAAGDGWEKLCPFLGKEQPRRIFPHGNTAEARKVKRLERKIKSFVRTFG